jgi:hypothetical protein
MYLLRHFHPPLGLIFGRYLMGYFSMLADAEALATSYTWHLFEFVGLLDNGSEHKHGAGLYRVVAANASDW